MSQQLTRALALHRAGQLTAAEQIYQQIVDTDPTNAEALHLLGCVRQRRGEHEQALILAGRAIALAPDRAAFHHGLALSLRALGRLDQAVASFRRALELDPQSATTHTSLGNVLRAQGKLPEAVQSHRRALAIDANAAEIWSNLGLTYRQWGRMDAALEAFSKAVNLRPDAPDLHHNLGNAQLSAGQPVAAEASLRRALEIAPNHHRAQRDLATALKDQGLLDQAENEGLSVIAAHPDDADAHWNLALTLLAAGKMQQGWKEYEWRRAIATIPMRRMSEPPWNGSSLAGRLLIHAEQGLGDMIQFVRYGALLRQRAGSRATLVFECHPALTRLLRSAPGFDEVIPRASNPPPFDAHLPLISAPRVLGTTASSVPADVPYLHAEAERVDLWRQRLPAAQTRVGICWQGNLKYQADAKRSVPLHHFAALARLPGVRLISLQKGPGEQQLQSLPDDLQVYCLPDLDTGRDAFVDTAAVMSCLDLVVCSDTAVAHLAGALGQPVWVALAKVPDWRWGLTGDRCAWYPTMRLFRQTQADDWDTVFTDVAQALQQESRDADSDRD